MPNYPIPLSLGHATNGERAHIIAEMMYNNLRRSDMNPPKMKVVIWKGVYGPMWGIAIYDHAKYVEWENAR